MDANHSQAGSFTVRGTFMTAPVNKNNSLIAVNGTNKTTGQGDICTQGIFRFSDFANPVTIAIVGGTGALKDAGGR